MALSCEIQHAFEPAEIDYREFSAVRHASPQRQREYLTGRKLARAALKSFGISEFTLLSSADGSPIWPPSVIGSITHNSSSCAVAVASAEKYMGLGIDIQEVSVVEPNIWHLFCTSHELQYLHHASPFDRRRLASVIFSAKEAFYKGRYPNEEGWLDFHDFSIALTFGAFCVSPLHAGVSKYEPGAGRYVVADTNVLTSFVVPRRVCTLGTRC